MDAVAVPPVPPWMDVTGFVVLVCSPVSTPVTLMAMVQLPLMGIRPFVSETTPVPAMAVAIPPQVLTNPLGFATFKPEGKLSVTATPDSAVVALGLLIVIASVVTPFRGITLTPNVLLMVGGRATTTVAVAGLTLVGASFVVSVELVFTLMPGLVPITLIEYRQLAFAGMVPEVIVSKPGVKFPARPQGLLRVLTKDRPTGSVSENATPVSGVALGLASVNVRVVVPLTGNAAAPNAFVITGGVSVPKVMLKAELLKSPLLFQTGLGGANSPVKVNALL